MDSDRMEGGARELGGKIKQAAGEMTGDVKTEVEGKIDEAAGTLQGAFGKARESAGEFANAAVAMAEDAGNHVYRHAVDAGSYAGEQIRQRPLAATLIAAGLGSVIGYLVGRVPAEAPMARGRRMAASQRWW